MPKREKLTLKRASFSLFGIEQTRKVVVLSKEQYPQNKWILKLLYYFCKTRTMEIRFEKEYLEELYLEGKTSEKKYRFPQAVVAKYCKVVDLLESIERAEDLYRYHSLNYKALSGNKKGIESVRVNDKYRIELRIVKRQTGAVLTVCSIIELSNHYKG